MRYTIHTVHAFKYRLPCGWLCSGTFYFCFACSLLRIIPSLEVLGGQIEVGRKRKRLHHPGDALPVWHYRTRGSRLASGNFTTKPMMLWDTGYRNNSVHIIMNGSVFIVRIRTIWSDLINMEQEHFCDPSLRIRITTFMEVLASSTMLIIAIFLPLRFCFCWSIDPTSTNRSYHDG